MARPSRAPSHPLASSHRQTPSLLSSRPSSSIRAHDSSFKMIVSISKVALGYCRAGSSSTANKEGTTWVRHPSSYKCCQHSDDFLSKLLAMQSSCGNGKIG